MVTFSYDDTLTGSIENLKQAVSELGVSASSSAAAIAQAMKAMIGLSSDYTDSLVDCYSILGGNGNQELTNYSHAEGALTRANDEYSWATGWNNAYGIMVDDRDRNTIFSIHNDAPLLIEPIELTNEDDNPFYIDPEIIQQGGWLDSDTDE